MKYSALSLCLIALSLSACDHYSSKMSAFDRGTSSYDVSQIQPASGVDAEANLISYDQGPHFSDYLKKLYVERATYEQTVGDYKAAKYYVERVDALNQGHLVTPMTLKKVKLAPKNKIPLTEAREALMEALNSKAIPENRYNLAVAQVSFDCWVDHTTESKVNSSCADTFHEAMGNLVEPNMIHQRYFLSLDGTELSASDQSILQEIVSTYKTSPDNSTRIVLNGFDGEKSNARMAMIKSFLQYNGVAPNSLSLQNNLEIGQGIEVIVKRPAAKLIETTEATTYTDSIVAH